MRFRCAPVVPLCDLSHRVNSDLQCSPVVFRRFFSSKPARLVGISDPQALFAVRPFSSQLQQQHHFAIATTDTAFKHMLSPASGSEKNIVISFLNSFIPAFRGDPVEDVEEAPVAVPAIKRAGQKQTFMDSHVISSKKVHYIIEMQAQRHVMFDERALFYACATIPVN